MKIHPSIESAEFVRAMILMFLSISGVISLASILMIVQCGATLGDLLKCIKVDNAPSVLYIVLNAEHRPRSHGQSSRTNSQDFFGPRQDHDDCMTVIHEAQLGVEVVLRDRETELTTDLGDGHETHYQD